MGSGASAPSSLRGAQQVVDPDDAQAMDGLPWSTLIFDAKKAETKRASQKLDGPRNWVVLKLWFDPQNWDFPNFRN